MTFPRSHRSKQQSSVLDPGILTPQTMGPVALHSSPSSSVHWLCNLETLTSPLCASAYSTALQRCMSCP